MEWLDLWQFTFTFTFTYPLVMDRRGATGVLATNSLHSSDSYCGLKPLWLGMGK